jgi:hypothetical protein
MSWKWICGREQATNALRFATKAACEDYGNNLGARWYGMPSPALAVECEDEITEGNEQAFHPAGHRVEVGCDWARSRAIEQATRQAALVPAKS